MIFTPLRSIALSAVLAIATCSAVSATTLTPTEMRAVREITSGGITQMFIMNVSRVTNGSIFDERTIAHFDITGVTTFTTASLSFGYAEDSGDGVIDFYAFAGDGAVSLDEYGAGTAPFATFTNTSRNDIGTLDITSLLQNAVLAGDSFLSFNLRAADRNGDFNLASTIGGVTDMGIFGNAAPTVISLTGVPAVPLPAAGWLMLGGLGGLVMMRRRTKAG